MTIEELKERFRKLYGKCWDEVCKQPGMDGESTGTNVERLGRVMELCEKRRWVLIAEYGESEYRRGLKERL